MFYDNMKDKIHILCTWYTPQKIDQLYRQPQGPNQFLKIVQRKGIVKHGNQYSNRNQHSHQMVLGKEFALIKSTNLRNTHNIRTQFQTSRFWFRIECEHEYSIITKPNVHEWIFQYVSTIFASDDF